jgi:hypothetical protein
MNDFPTYFTGEHALSMTMRDYFAAKAMQALLTTDNFNIPSLARDSYAMADGMIKARENV